MPHGPTPHATPTPSLDDSHRRRHPFSGVRRDRADARSTRLPTRVRNVTLDWLIVGGGIHGTHIAARLLGDADVAPDRIRIVDPGERLLARWRTCTETIGMTHLRSPSVHHLDADPWSLNRFAGKRKRRDPGLFAAPFERPSLALFNAHCDLVEAHEHPEGLPGVHLVGVVDVVGVLAQLDLGADQASVGRRLLSEDRDAVAALVR